MNNGDFGFSRANIRLKTFYLLRVSARTIKTPP